MSAHFSKYGLNTYYATPYFQAHIPVDYPLERVLMKSHAFRRLPPHLRKLAALAKKWAIRSYQDTPGGRRDIEQWYDADGYELDPGDGHRLTDEEIDAQWERWTQLNADLAKFKVEDIPLPAGGFADPDTWEEPEKPDEEEEYEGPSEEKLLEDIKSYGRKYTVRYYGIPPEEVKEMDDKELARAIFVRIGGTRPAP
jgi:hypothetical protein